MPLQNDEVQEEKIQDDQDSMKRLSDMLGQLQEFIQSMGKKKGNILIKWLERKISYIRDENEPKSTNGYYKRGQIVHVDLGFNVGGELGGGHFAVVLWTQDRAATVTVAPLTSQKPDKQVKEQHRDYHVTLGEHLEEGTISIIKVEQIRAVSKLRVQPMRLQTKNRTYKTDKLTAEQLDQLDQAIVRLYTRPQ